MDVLALDAFPAQAPGLRSFIGDAGDRHLVEDMLRNKQYDGVIDYMIYATEDFKTRHRLLLDHTGHYIYLSSYRVYADDRPLTESSRRLLDVATDREYLASGNYSLYKAEQEDILAASGKTNWTAVRPSITYSRRRFQLVTLEVNVLVERSRADKAVMLPRAAQSVQATMTWAGDTAKMFSGILFQPRALGQRYTFSTAEHRTWGEIAQYYHQVIGTQVCWADTKDYLRILTGSPQGYLDAKYQLLFDRLYDRVVDNAKVLRDAGLRQEEMTPLKEGLRRELTALGDFRWTAPAPVSEKMDAYIAAHT